MFNLIVFLYLWTFKNVRGWGNKEITFSCFEKFNWKAYCYAYSLLFTILVFSQQWETNYFDFRNKWFCLFEEEKSLGLRFLDIQWHISEVTPLKSRELHQCKSNQIMAYLFFLTSCHLKGQDEHPKTEHNLTWFPAL